jgi:hypothetical protein
MIYTAQAFDPEAGCLAAYAPLGLVEAEELASTCAPVCLRLGESLYVSNACPPFPTEATSEAPDPESECAAALEALEAATYCDDS